MKQSAQCTITEEDSTLTLENYAHAGFKEYALETIGHHGEISIFAFALRQGDAIVGVITAKIFYKALVIRHLFIEKKWRRQGYGVALMQKAIEKGQKVGCHFAHLETMDFQALGFYQKLGFTLEFTRKGYAHGVEMHYLKKEL